jgi:hypothetical protein
MYPGGRCCSSRDYISLERRGQQQHSGAATHLTDSISPISCCSPSINFHKKPLLEQQRRGKVRASIIQISKQQIVDLETDFLGDLRMVAYIKVLASTLSQKQTNKT